MKNRLFYIFILLLAFSSGYLPAQENSTDSATVDAYLIGLGKRKLGKEHTCAIVFKNATVVDLEKGTVQKHRTVFTIDGQVWKVKRRLFAGSKKGAKVIDASGKYLAPGLTDYHVHFKCTNRDRLLYLLYGVTTIRNMAGSGFHLQDKHLSGVILGPQMITAGPTISSQAGFMSVQVIDTASAHRVVHEQKNTGYDFIKTDRSLSIPCLMAILEEAKKSGMRVAAELPENMAPESLIPYAAILSVENAMDVSKADPASLRALAGKGLLNCPNLAAIAGASRIRSVDKWKAKSAEGTFLSVQQEEALHDLTDPRAAAYFVKLNKAHRASFKKLYQSGITFLAGTESGLPIPAVVPGASLHDEMNELVLAGMTPLEAIRCATTNGQSALSSDTLTTRKEDGYRNSGLLLLSANPLEDVKNYRAIEGLLYQGAWLGATDLEELRKILTEIRQ